MIRMDENIDLCKIVIEDEMTIYTASQLKEDFRPIIMDKRSLTISLQNVSEIDSSGIQLLMLIKRERQKIDLVTQFIDHSDEVQKIINLIRLNSYFNINEDDHAT